MLDRRGERYFFFLALIDGQPVSYRCLSLLIHPGVEGFVRLRPQIFMVDEFTVPAFRRRGITRRMAIAMAPGLIAQGCHEVVGIPRTGMVTRWCLPGRVGFTFEAEPSRAMSAPVTVLDATLITGPGPLTDPGSPA